jgi:hypothetical protein
MNGATMRMKSDRAIHVPPALASTGRGRRWWLRRRSQRGLSLVEMLVTLAISVTVITVVMTIIEEAMKMSLFVESHNDLAVMSQRPINSIQKDLLQSRALFGEDTGATDGTDYRTTIEALIPAGVTHPVGSVLPIVNGAGVLAPDTGGVRTAGNCLLVARQLTPILLDIAADGTFPAISAFVVDRYQFEYIYLSRNATRKFPGGNYSLDLYRYRSVPYADYFQLSNGTANLSTTQKTNLSTKIRATIASGGANLQMAWNPGMDLLHAFYTIDASLAFPTIVTTGLLTMQDNTSLLPELLKGRISGKMDYTVAYRVGATAPGTNIPGLSGLNAVPVYFETASAPLDCGFEVKVVGPIGNRRVLTRLVLYSNYGITKFGSQEGFVITSG